MQSVSLDGWIDGWGEVRDGGGEKGKKKGKQRKREREGIYIPVSLVLSSSLLSFFPSFYINHEYYRWSWNPLSLSPVSFPVLSPQRQQLSCPSVRGHCFILSLHTTRTHTPYSSTLCSSSDLVWFILCWAWYAGTLWSPSFHYISKLHLCCCSSGVGKLSPSRARWQIFWALGVSSGLCFIFLFIAVLVPSSMF